MRQAANSERKLQADFWRKEPNPFKENEQWLSVVKY